MYVITYGSDATRSAGDLALKTLCAARRAFHRLITEHPEAETWLHRQERGCLGQTLLHYDPYADTPISRAA